MTNKEPKYNNDNWSFNPITGNKVLYINIYDDDMLNKAGLPKAKLISAAPDLLEACIKASELCSVLKMPRESDLIALDKILQQAIQKALTL